MTAPLESASSHRADRAAGEASELRLRALLDGMLDPVVTIDGTGTVQEASASVRTVFGWEPRELVGENIRVLMPEPHRSQHDSYLERYHRTGETGILQRTREFQVVRKDGAVIDCELSVSRVDVPGESRPLFIGSFRDVTARRRAERELLEREQRYRAVFDQEFQFVGLLSPTGEVLDVNRTALEAAGVEREAIVGEPFWDTPWWDRTEGARELVKKSIAAAARGEFVRFETVMRDASGRPIDVDFSLKPVRDAQGAIVLLLPEGRDVTVIKDAQRRESQVQKALAAIGESASILIHEIKNPITGIHFAIQAVADQLGEDHREILRGLEASLQRVERTMRRTLTFARPLAIERRPVAVPELIESVVRSARAAFPTSKVALEVACEPDLPLLAADEGLLEEVLTNLVRNALEALTSGHVRLLAKRAGPDQVLLSVEDDGPGIPDYVLPNLFRPFYTTKEHGTGIGLALCQKIVEAHGGQIRGGASALGGACFEITLPLDG